MYEAVLKGITPVLMHRYVAGTVSGTCDGEDDIKLKDTFGNTDYSDEWKKSAYVSMEENELDTMDKTIVIPNHVLEACFREAGAKFKVKGQRTAKSAMVSGIMLEGMEQPFIVNGGTKISLKDIEANDWLHTAGVKIGKSRVDRIRPYVPVPWRLKLRFDINHPELKPKIVKQVMSIAGTLCGIGDWRPNSPKPGSFGRFEVESFQEV